MMKLNRTQDEQTAIDEGGIVLRSVDCRICGAKCVPHLVWTDSQPEKAGLCDEHFKELFDAQAN